MWHNALHKETAPGSGEKMARFHDQDKEAAALGASMLSCLYTVL